MKNKKDALIWKLESEGIPHTSYLIGTMHVKDASAFVRMVDMRNCIDACDVFATEFNLEEADHNLTAETMALEEGQSLETLLGTKKYAKIRKSIAKSFGVDLNFFKYNTPILVINVLTEKILSDDMQSSLDESLWQYASEKNKIMMGIETFGEQMDILANISLDYQLKQLKELSKQTKKFKEQIHKTADLFKKEDIRQLYKAVKKSAGEIRDMMLYDRNIIMADRFAKIAAEQSICFALGAGHLSGKKGVLKLLKNKGFSVRPIPISHHVTDIVKS